MKWCVWLLSSHCALISPLRWKRIQNYVVQLIQLNSYFAKRNSIWSLASATNLAYKHNIQNGWVDDNQVFIIFNIRLVIFLSSVQFVYLPTSLYSCMRFWNMQSAVAVDSFSLIWTLFALPFIVGFAFEFLYIFKTFVSHCWAMFTVHHVHYAYINDFPKNIVIMGRCCVFNANICINNNMINATSSVYMQKETTQVVRIRN